MRLPAFLLGTALFASLPGPAEAQRPPTPATPAPATTPARPHPAIWLLSDADTKIYLFGTYHLLPRGFSWRSPLFDSITRHAEELVVEIANVASDRNAAAMREQMQIGKQAPLAWRVSPARRAALHEMIAALGVREDAFDGLQTWVAAMTLGMAPTMRHMLAERPESRSGTAPDGPTARSTEADSPADARSAERQFAALGVEGQLEAEFASRNRPISGVETVAQQMAAFGSMSFADQRAMLESLVDAYRFGGAKATQVATVTDAGEGDWALGRVEVMDAMALSMRGPLYNALLRDRNRAWTDWRGARLARPGTLLFAVGAAHLAGPDSVVRLLGARGFHVRRIQ